MSSLDQHVADLHHALGAIDVELPRIERWGRLVASRLLAGGRLLAVGNGGSAAQAQHLTAELVGRYLAERQPLSAIALHAETSSLTAIVNDYGPDEAFARQVRAHGRAGDVLVALSTSGRSSNVLAAVAAAADLGIEVLALTGAAPNPLAEAASDALCVAGPTATVQEVHLLAIHLLCESVDDVVLAAEGRVGHQAPGSPERHREPVIDLRAESRIAGESAADQRPKICVVGDLLADSDIRGAADRLSPEAPVLVVDEESVIHRPGGAGLAAVLAARHGAEVTLVTAMADDVAGNRIRDLLNAESVAVCALPWNGTTVEKVRIAAGGVPLLRLDRGEGHVAEVPDEGLARAARDAIIGADAVLVSDYGRGMAAHPLIRDAVHAAREAGKAVVWDPHPKGPPPVPGCTLVCPNCAEAKVHAPEIDGTGLAADIERARSLRRCWEASAVAITLGCDGAVVALGDGAPLRIPVLAPADAADTCGAGDAFAAAAAVAMGRGAVISEAVQAAVDAASTFVVHGGAGAMESPVAEPSPPHRAGGVLVATGGCFDLLHPGHVHTLRAARRLGDRLVVLVNDDASVRRLKGPERPLQSVEDRCAVLQSLADVDEVVVFSDDTPVEALRRLRPDVWVKGGDYTAADLPETAVLAEWGGSVVTVPFLDGRSTTELVSRVRAGVEQHEEPGDRLSLNL